MLLGVHYGDHLPDNNELISFLPLLMSFLVLFLAGDTSTTVTQSITTPLTNAMESKAPSCVSTPRVMGPPPPRSSIPPSQIDSSSQDSHSSSQDSDNDKVKVKNEIKQVGFGIRLTKCCIFMIYPLILVWMITCHSSVFCFCRRIPHLARQCTMNLRISVVQVGQERQ